MHIEKEYLQSPKFQPSKRLRVISHWGGTPFEIWPGTEVFLAFLYFLQKNDKVVPVDKHWVMKESKCKEHTAALHSVICGDELLAPPFASLLLTFFLWRCDPTRVMVSSLLRFLDHTQWRTTVGRTPLDEWSARRRDLYLTTHDIHNRQTSMPLVGFEPTISAGERPQGPAVYYWHNVLNRKVA